MAERSSLKSPVLRRLRTSLDTKSDVKTLAFLTGLPNFFLIEVEIREINGDFLKGDKSFKLNLMACYSLQSTSFAVC